MIYIYTCYKEKSRISNGGIEGEFLGYALTSSARNTKCLEDWQLQQLQEATITGFKLNKLGMYCDIGRNQAAGLLSGCLLICC
jgi:hypothetical protein